MGMYDNIETPPIQCRKCKNLLTGWQSKDGECMLDTLNFLEVNSFYTSCNKCNTWHEYVRKPAKTINDFELQKE